MAKTVVVLHAEIELSALPHWGGESECDEMTDDQILEVWREDCFEDILREARLRISRDGVRGYEYLFDGTNFDEIGRVEWSKPATLTPEPQTENRGAGGRDGDLEALRKQAFNQAARHGTCTAANDLARLAKEARDSAEQQTAWGHEWEAQYHEQEAEIAALRDARDLAAGNYRESDYWHGRALRGWERAEARAEMAESETSALRARVEEVEGAYLEALNASFGLVVTLRRAVRNHIDDEHGAHLREAVDTQAMSSGPDLSKRLKSDRAKELYRALENAQQTWYRDGVMFPNWEDPSLGGTAAQESADDEVRVEPIETFPLTIHITSVEPLEPLPYPWEGEKAESAGALALSRGEADALLMYLDGRTPSDAASLSEYLGVLSTAKRRLREITDENA